MYWLYFEVNVMKNRNPGVNERVYIDFELREYIDIKRYKRTLKENVQSHPYFEPWIGSGKCGSTQRQKAKRRKGEKKKKRRKGRNSREKKKIVEPNQSVSPPRPIRVPVEP